MDPVSLIISALTAGAVRVAQGTAEDAVKAAYDRLKTLILRRFAADPDKRRELESFEADPSRSSDSLERALAESGVHRDDAALTAARTLMERVDPEGVARGVYTIHAGGNVQNVVQGNNNVVSFGGDRHDSLR